MNLLSLSRAFVLVALTVYVGACQKRSPGGMASSESGQAEASIPDPDSRESCQDRANDYRAAFERASRCSTASDCVATSDLLTGPYNTSNCRLAINPRLVTDEVRAVAREYHEHCSRGERVCGHNWPAVTCLKGTCGWEAPRPPEAAK